MADARLDYKIGTEVRFAPLELIDVPSVRAEAGDQWTNEVLSRVNDSVVRLGIVEGEFHWHKHDRDDEFFYCLDGELFVDIENGPTFALQPHQGVTVPKGVVHRTRAPARTSMLMVETAAIVATGD